MYEDMFVCIGYYILVRVVGVINLQWTTNGKYCIGVGIGGKTNDTGAWLKMLMMSLHGTINLIKKGIRQQIHDQEDGEQIP